MKSSQFIDKFTTRLESLEQELERELGTVQEERFSTIFVVGLPRSGTTLLTQIVFRNTNAQCTNNFIARFWKTPLVGAYLSKMTIAPPEGDRYQSEYGRTWTLSDPHEFSWFWHDLLNIRDPYQHRPEQNKNEIDWSRVFQKLININNIFEAPIVHKPMELVGMYAESFIQTFKKSIFLFIDRDSTEIAYSIFLAKMENEKAQDQWWGSIPDAEVYGKLKKYNLPKQIAGQIKYFHQLYREKFSSLTDEDRIIITTYEELCSNPEILLKKLENYSNKINGGIEVLSIPSPFRKTTKSIKSDIGDRLKFALEESEVDRFCFVQNR